MFFCPLIFLCGSVVGGSVNEMVGKSMTIHVRRSYVQGESILEQGPTHLHIQ